MMCKTILGWRIWVGVLAFSGLAVFHSANAATSVRTMKSCSLSPTSTMVFNTTLVSNLSTTTSFTLSCTSTSTNGSGNAPLPVTISMSAGSSASTVNRTMKQSAAVLTYDLYQDAAYANKWLVSPGTANELTVTVNADSFSQLITVYGLINSSAANKNLPTGTYTDPIITATVTWP